MFILSVSFSNKIGSKPTFSAKFDFTGKTMTKNFEFWHA